MSTPASVVKSAAPKGIFRKSRIVVIFPKDGPRKSHVVVSAATPGKQYPRPDITMMKSDGIQELYFGFLVSIWVDLPNCTPLRPEGIQNISIGALMSISPLIKGAVLANGPSIRDIDHIILPSGHLDAYRMLFRWLDNTTKTGVYNYIEPEHDSPLFKYYHLLEIASKLQIKPVLTNLAPRYNTMLTYKKNSYWNIQPGDIRRVYRELLAGHELRKAIVHCVALAWYHKDLSGPKLKGIKELAAEINEFWMDLDECWVRFEQEGL